MAVNKPPAGEVGLKTAEILLAVKSGYIRTSVRKEHWLQLQTLISLEVMQAEACNTGIAT